MATPELPGATNTNIVNVPAETPAEVQRLALELADEQAHRKQLYLHIEAMSRLIIDDGKEKSALMKEAMGLPKTMLKAISGLIDAKEKAALERIAARESASGKGTNEEVKQSAYGVLLGLAEKFGGLVPDDAGTLDPVDMAAEWASTLTDEEQQRVVTEVMKRRAAKAEQQAAEAAEAAPAAEGTDQQ